MKHATTADQRHSNPTEALRAYLRDPAHATSDADPVERHRTALASIWQCALIGAHGDERLALQHCLIAVRAVPYAGESSDDYTARMRGIPTHVFGTEPKVVGNDKPSHFIACALVAYLVAEHTPTPAATGLGELAGKSIGRLKEVADQVLAIVYDASDAAAEALKTISHGLIDLPDVQRITHGGYDTGDIAADDLGAAFGAALARAKRDGSPAVDIRDYCAPEHAAVPTAARATSAD